MIFHQLFEKVTYIEAIFLQQFRTSVTIFNHNDILQEPYEPQSATFKQK